ncbi:MAG: FHA domain-containing protein [Myxococcales bacterium]|nr:FHA domain-containing protein [Myxococcales bacterium]
MLAVIVSPPDGEPARLTFEQAEVTIGRNERCDVLVQGDVAETHARLVTAGPMVMVLDVSLTTGVFVNGARIEGPPAADTVGRRARRRHRAAGAGRGRGAGHHARARRLDAARRGVLGAVDPAAPERAAPASAPSTPARARPRRRAPGPPSRPAAPRSLRERAAEQPVQTDELEEALQHIRPEGSRRRLVPGHPTLAWQAVQQSVDGRSTRSKLLRAKVPGGWLLRLEETRSDVGMVPGLQDETATYGWGWAWGGIAFYPDPEHRWDGSSLS